MATRDVYERIAGWYDLLDFYFEYTRYRSIRRDLFAGISGRVLDAGVGTGRNMAFYPAHGEMTGIDLSSAMLRRAVQRRDRSGIAVELHEADVPGVPGGIVAHTAGDLTVDFTHEIWGVEPRRHLPAEQLIPNIGPAPNFVGIVGKRGMQDFDVEMLPCFQCEGFYCHLFSGLAIVLRSLGREGRRGREGGSMLNRTSIRRTILTGSDTGGSGAWLGRS